MFNHFLFSTYLFFIDFTKCLETYVSLIMISLTEISWLNQLISSQSSWFKNMIVLFWNNKLSILCSNRATNLSSWSVLSLWLSAKFVISLSSSRISSWLLALLQIGLLSRTDSNKCIRSMSWSHSRLFSFSFSSFLKKAKSTSFVSSSRKFFK